MSGIAPPHCKHSRLLICDPILRQQDELLLILPEATRNSPVATMPSRNGATLPGHAYLTAFKETVKEAIEAAKEVDGDTHGEVCPSFVRCKASAQH